MGLDGYVSTFVGDREFGFVATRLGLNREGTQSAKVKWGIRGKMNAIPG